MNVIMRKYVCADLPDEVADIVEGYLGYVRTNEGIHRVVNPRVIMYNRGGRGLCVNRNIVCIDGRNYYMKM